MITQDNHDLAVIKDVRDSHFKKKDPMLVEKILKALSLLELISVEGLEFVFKGGTCLLILLEEPKRFSIDLDMIVDDTKAIIPVLNKICGPDKLFKSFVEDKRKESKIPKSHYKVFYNSVIDNKEAYILIDLIEGKSTYPREIQSEIKPYYFKTVNPFIKIKTPSINAILGDKLTAFAPHTTGIKIDSKRDMEIAKQLFDVATLFDHADDINEVHQSFIKTANLEIKYRGLEINVNDVLADNFEAAYVIAMQNQYKPEIYSILNSGTSKLKGYVFESFGQVEVHICAAKSAYLSQLLKQQVFTVEKFTNQDMKNIVIQNSSYTRLNIIKRISPEAFYYWMKAVNLIE
ncbi:MAG: nucleotidyl transferase AbiEii/AbiGii toxin family protein [Bacteriovoracaceae bacterium]